MAKYRFLRKVCVAVGTGILRNPVLSYCDWVYTKVKIHIYLIPVTLHILFYELRQDLTLLAYAAHMLELIQDTTFENQPAREPLKLLLHAMHALSNEKRNPELIIRVFTEAAATHRIYAFLAGCCDVGQSKSKIFVSVLMIVD